MGKKKKDTSEDTNEMDIKEEERKDINITFDLDNTLIYSIPFEKYPKRDCYLHEIPHYFMDKDYVVFERPGLQKFLDWVFKHFNVMVWSAASPEYVEFIAKNIIEKNGRKLEYVLNSENCEDSQQIFGENHIKNLKMLWDIHDLDGYGPYNTLIIDDLKMVCKIQPKNSINIKCYNVTKKDSKYDTELKNIKRMLKKIKKNYVKKINGQSPFSLINDDVLQIS